MRYTIGPIGTISSSVSSIFRHKGVSAPVSRLVTQYSRTGSTTLARNVLGSVAALRRRSARPSSSRNTTPPIRGSR